MKPVYGATFAAVLFAALLTLSLSAHALVGPQVLDAGMLNSGGGGGGGSSIACDYGPNLTLPTGQVGTDLAAAGFQHCAMNADFTDNSGVAGGNGWVMNNLNTYVNQCAGTTAWGQLWWMWVTGAGENGSGANAPCNRLSIINDPGGGGFKVLTYQFANSDIVKGSQQSNSQMGLGIWWPLCGDACSNQRPALPNANYMEITYKVSPASTQQNPNQIFDALEQTIFDADPAEYNPGTGVIFLDFPMLESQANSGGVISNGTNTTLNTELQSGAQANTLAWTPDTTNYHTLGWLTTTNAVTGSTGMSSCFYYDGAAVTPGTGSNGWSAGKYCSYWPSGFNGGMIIPHDNRFWKFIGPFCNFPFNVCGTLGNTITTYVKSFRVITCTNYKGSGNDCTAAESGGSVVYH